MKMQFNRIVWLLAIVVMALLFLSNYCSAQGIVGDPPGVYRRAEYALVDYAGKIVCELPYGEVDWWDSGFARVSNGNQHHERGYGYINATGELVVPMIYAQAEPFSRGFAAVFVGADQATGRWGYVDESGKLVIKPRFVSADCFNYYGASIQKDLAFVIDEDGKRGFIQKDGNFYLVVNKEPPDVNGLDLIDFAKKVPKFELKDEAWVYRYYDKFIVEHPNKTMKGEKTPTQYYIRKTAADPTVNPLSSNPIKSMLEREEKPKWAIAPAGAYPWAKRGIFWRAHGQPELAAAIFEKALQEAEREAIPAKDIEQYITQDWQELEKKGP